MASIGIDARKYFDYGIGTYLQSLLREFASEATRHEFTLFVSPGERNAIPAPSNWKVMSAPWKKYSFSELFFFGRRAATAGIDIFHVPHYTLPFGVKGPSVVTIHDLIHLHFPQFYSRAHRLYAQWVIGHAVGSASIVITPSEYVRNDIASQFSLPSDKVRVIPLAAPGNEGRISETERRRFLERHQLRNRYILYVGGLGYHKDIDTLFRSFDMAAQRIGDFDLVLAGVSPQNKDELTANVKARHRIRFLGRIGRSDLRAAYSSASLLVTASRYEGFGLPPLEAMAYGTPCVVSDAGALPEVVGDAALICSVGRSEQFAEAIETLLTQASVHSEMIQRGYKNIRRFSWKTTARQTLEVYDSLA